MQKEADLAASIEEASTWGLQVAAAVVEATEIAEAEEEASAAATAMTENQEASTVAAAEVTGKVRNFSFEIVKFIKNIFPLATSSNCSRVIVVVYLHL